MYNTLYSISLETRNSVTQIPITPLASGDPAFNHLEICFDQKGDQSKFAHYYDYNDVVVVVLTVFPVMNTETGDIFRWSPLSRRYIMENRNHESRQSRSSMFFSAEELTRYLVRNLALDIHTWMTASRNNGNLVDLRGIPEILATEIPDDLILVKSIPVLTVLTSGYDDPWFMTPRQIEAPMVERYHSLCQGDIFPATLHKLANTVITMIHVRDYSSGNRTQTGYAYSDYRSAECCGPVMFKRPEQSAVARKPDIFPDRFGKVTNRSFSRLLKNYPYAINSLFTETPNVEDATEMVQLLLTRIMKHDNPPKDPYEYQMFMILEQTSRLVREKDYFMNEEYANSLPMATWVTV